MSQTLQSEPAMTQDEKVERFVRLLSQAERRLYSYIYSLMPNTADAEEVQQETSLVLWRKIDQYEDETDFLAWARKVAFYEVKKYREKQRSGRLLFSQDTVDSLADAVEERAMDLEPRLAPLAECLEGLGPDDREIIEMRYTPGVSSKDVAEEFGRTTEGMYKTLQRIRGQLHDCVERKMRQEDSP